jgi:hypothetical protein
MTSDNGQSTETRKVIRLGLIAAQVIALGGAYLYLAEPAYAIGSCIRQQNCPGGTKGPGQYHWYAGDVSCCLDSSYGITPTMTQAGDICCCSYSYEGNDQTFGNC